MMRVSVLLLTLVCQVQAVHVPKARSNSSNSSKAEKTVPASNPDAQAPVVQAQQAKKAETQEDKEDREAIAGLVNGLNKLETAGGAAGQAMRQKAMERAHARVLVVHNTSHKNVTNAVAKAPAPNPKKDKETKEGEEAIAGLVNGLNKLPMRGGKVSPVAVKVANLKRSHTALPATKTQQVKQATLQVKKATKNTKVAHVSSPPRNEKANKAQILKNQAREEGNQKKTALVSHAAAPAPGSPRDVEQGKRIQHALEAADAAEKSVPQEEKEAHDQAEEARRILKIPSR